MIANPVFLNDLRRSLIRRKPVHVVAYLALTILVLTICIFAGLPSAFMMNYRSFPIWTLPDLLLPVVVPAFAAGSFAKEHEQRTWNDVLLTQLGSWEILRGKFCACLLPTLATIIVLMPPFAMILVLQGVDWALDFGPWLLIVFMKFLISAFFYIALVMLCSFYLKSGRVALVVSYTMLAIYGICNYVMWMGMMMWFVAGLEANSDVDQDLMGKITGMRQGHDFQFSLVETLHCCQSLVFGLIILFFLNGRLLKRK